MHATLLCFKLLNGPTANIRNSYWASEVLYSYSYYTGRVSNADHSFVVLWVCMYVGHTRVSLIRMKDIMFTHHAAASPRELLVVPKLDLVLDYRSLLLSTLLSQATYSVPAHTQSANPNSRLYFSILP